MHETISPAILYWGTPTLLITTQNPDGTPNISPMSSAWWLGHRCMLGLGGFSQTTQNLLRTKQCVLNLPSEILVPSINRLAKTTGCDPVSDWKRAAGYEHVKDKFTHAGLTPMSSELVDPPRIAECPVQMEAQMVVKHGLMDDLPDKKGALVAVELKILRVHVESELRLPGYRNRIDAGMLRPVFMVFQEYYGIGSGKLGPSRLAEIKEDHYRGITRSGAVRQGADGELVESEDEEAKVDTSYASA